MLMTRLDNATNFTNSEPLEELYICIQLPSLKALQTGVLVWFDVFCTKGLQNTQYTKTSTTHYLYSNNNEQTVYNSRNKNVL